MGTNKLRGLFTNEVYSSMIITDRDLVLTNTVESTFLSSRYFLCRWHINHNTLENYKKKFGSTGRVGEIFLDVEVSYAI